jgi:hypothetical protein
MLPEMKQLDINGFSFKVVDGEARTLASSAVTSANAYTDEKIALLMDNSSEAVDSIMELAQAMKDNEDIVDALEQAIGGKASVVHEHEQYLEAADIAGLASTTYVDEAIANITITAITDEEIIALCTGE